MNAVAEGLFIGTLNRADARARAHAPWNDIKIARRWFIPRWYCPRRERALETQRGKGARGKGLYGGVRFIADFDCSKRAAVLHGLFAPLVVFYDSRALDNSRAQCCRNNPADTIGMLLAQPHFSPSSVAASRGRRSLRASASLVLVSHGRDQRRWTRGLVFRFRSFNVCLFSVERRVPAGRWERSRDSSPSTLRRGTQGDSSKIAAGKYVRAAT